MPPADKNDALQTGTLQKLLTAQGLILRGAFHPTDEDDAPTGTGTLIMVGNAGPEMWQTFQSTHPDGADPLNHWTRQVLETVAERTGATALFPFEGPPYWPFLRWAARAEGVYPSPLGMMIHPRFGLWHAWRGALAFRDQLDLPERTQAANPCDTCSDKPCLTACPVSAFGNAGYDTTACAAWLRGLGGSDCVTRGCAARHACPEGKGYRYEPPQAALHMASFVAGRPDNGLRLRDYRSEDAPALAQLFYDSVHHAAADEYTPAQRAAWAPKVPDKDWIHSRMSACVTFIVTQGSVISGFANLEQSGLIDMFYVHADRQRLGVGRLLYRRIEGAARNMGLPRLTADVSITARPFFESMGFTVITPQTITLDSVELSNFVMEKPLTRSAPLQPR